jgi:hypothetical protein
MTDKKSSSALNKCSHLLRSLLIPTIHSNEDSITEIFFQKALPLLAGLSINTRK